MASSLSRSAYSDAFLQDDSPARVGNLLRARLAAARETNDRLADFIAERAELEEAYAAGLQRSLSKLKTGPSGKTPFNLTAQGNAALGASSARSLERSIDQESQKLAKLHAAFAKRCRDEIELPLRQRSAREDWQSLTRLDKQTDSLLRDVEDAQSKVHKAQGKSGGSTFGGGKKNAEKLASLVEAQTRAEAAWKNHVAGTYFQQYQSVDYARLNTLKELITVFETLQNDLGRERMETAERGLEAALTWEVDQELAEFVSSQGFRTGAGGQRGGSGRVPGIGVTSPTSTNLAGEFGARDANEAQRPRANTVTSSRSIRSNGRPASIVSSSRQQSSDGGAGTPQKSGGLLSAFKVGNRLDRRKSTAVHSQTQPQPQPQSQSQAGAGARPSLQSNGDDEESLSAAASAGRGGIGGGRASDGSSLRDRERQQSYRSNASSSDNVNLGGGSEDNLGALRPSGASKKTSNRTSFMPSFGLGGRKNSSRGGGGGAGGAQLGEEDEDDERSQAEQLATPPATATANTSRSLNPFSALAATGAGGNAGDRPLSQASDATSRPMNTTYGEYGSDAQSPPASASASAAVDAQGFSVPPAGYDRPLGGTSGAGGEANLMDMADSDEENDAQSPSQSMRVSIAPVAPLAKSTDDSADREAMLRLKNTLLSSSSSSSSAGGPLNRRGTRAGRGSRQSTLGLASPGATPGLLTPSPPGMPRIASDDIPIQTLLDMHKQQAQQQPDGTGAGESARERTATAGSSIRSSGSPTEMLASPTLTSMAGGGRAGSILSTSSSQQNLAHAASSTSPFGASSAGNNSTNGSSGAPSFRAAILETVNVLLKAGEVQRVMITGEVIFSARNLPKQYEGEATLRIPNFSQFDKHAPNGAILTARREPGEFTINTGALQATQGSNTTVFKYQLDTASIGTGTVMDSKAYVPLEFTPQWKIEERQTSFLMAYSGNPGCRFQSGEVSPFGDSEEEGSLPLVLQDVSFSVPVSPACGGVSSLQTKPQGSYSSEKRRILWKMDELDLAASGGKVAKVLARFATESEGSPMPVSVQWRLPGRLASGLQLEIEGGGLRLDEVVRNTQSGKYVAQP